MHMLVISGFFGSGKSSFLLRAARYYTGKLGMRIAVVQNEISPDGVDDKQLRADGLVVSELLGGCICCDLANQLITTLLKVERELSPELILLEASGMATPTMLRKLLDESGLEFEWIRQIALLDASRYRRLERLLDIPLLRDAVLSSDLCLLNKIDLSVPDAVTRFRREAEKAGALCALFETVLTDSDEIPETVQSAITPTPTNRRPGIRRPNPGRHTHGPHPVVFATQTEPGRDFLSVEKVRIALHTFSEALKTSGCTQVGHVKLFFESDSGSAARASLTDLGMAPDLHGFHSNGNEVSTITINAIVYGLNHPILEKLSRNLLKELKHEH